MGAEKNQVASRRVHFRGLQLAKFALGIAAFATAAPSFSECLALVKGPVVMDVMSCGTVDPAGFDLTKPRFKFIADLDVAGRQQLLAKYRGLAVKGVVVQSQAIRDGISTEKGVLQSENVLMFVPPGTGQCSTFNGKRIAATVSEKCCDGTGDAPCLLGNGYVLSGIKVSGDAKVGTDGKNIGNARNSKPHGKEYLAAEQMYAIKKYKESVKLFTRADGAGDMDVKGLFRWGNALREVEDCSGAINPLKRVYDLQQQNKVFTDEELDARRSIFLLARCHAKQGDPSLAVFYLNGFLLEAKKYKSELQQALHHKDFGWIHTSKEYREFKAEAEKRLREVK